MEKIHNPNNSVDRINNDLEKLSNWAKQWLVNFNPSKTKFILFSKKVNKPNLEPILLDGKEIDRVTSHCQLGITFNEKMTWENHIRDRCNVAMKRVTLLKRLALKVPRSTKLTIYTAFIRPILEYGSVVFDNCTSELSEEIENVQRQAVLSITGAYVNTSHISLLAEVGLCRLSQRRTMAKLVLLFKIVNGLVPSYLRTLLTKAHICDSKTRNEGYIKLPTDDRSLLRKNYFLKSFIPSTVNLWNKLKPSVRAIHEIDTFKTAITKIYSPCVLYKPYLWGFSKGFVNLSRIRMGLSALNAQRKKYHFINDSSCPNCGARHESPDHFLLLCPAYHAARVDMVNELLKVPQIQIEPKLQEPHKNKTFLTKTFLKGTENEVLDIRLFSIIASYIEKTNRF